VDSHKRSWTKSITWRVVGVFILGGITWAFTRDAVAVTGITLTFHSIRLILYYWHERLWERIAWGKKKHPLEHFCLKENLTAADIQEIHGLLVKEGYVGQSSEYQI
jgi:uncharacterized membrane protein